MSQSFAFEFNAEPRTAIGKAATRRLRRAKKVPAIIYGANLPPAAIMLELKDVMKTLSHEAVYSHILTLTVGGKSEKVVLKDLDRHPIKPEVTHLDFQRIIAGEKIIMHVPLHFLNEDTCPGVKEQDGIISHLVKDLEIKCLPEHLPEYIEIDLAQLKLDEAISLSEIKLPAGVELVGEIDEDHDITIVSIHRARAEEVDAVATEAESTETSEESVEADKADDKATEE